jgi:HPt (histidine-containing phosphotransfer) domain-containing protein
MVTTNMEYLNLDYLNMMTGNDAEMMQTMLGMLAEEIPTEFEKMDSAIKNREWNDLFNISHKMKTTLAFIGNEEMIELNKDIELAARHENGLERIAPMFKKMGVLGDAVLIEMKGMIND